MTKLKTETGWSLTWLYRLEILISRHGHCVEVWPYEMDVHKEEDLEKADIDGHGGVGKNARILWTSFIDGP